MNTSEPLEETHYRGYSDLLVWNVRVSREGYVGLNGKSNLLLSMVWGQEIPPGTNKKAYENRSSVLS